LIHDQINFDISQLLFPHLGLRFKGYSSGGLAIDIMDSPVLQLQEQNLKGKTAVVTGASKGIGRAITTNLALRGCRVLGTCSGSETVPEIQLLSAHIGKVYEDTSKHRDRIVGVAANVFDAQCANTIAESVALELDSRVDIFVNNAAYAMPEPIGEMSVEHIQQGLIGNIQTPVLIVEEFVRRKFFQPNSRIIYISSIRSKLPWSDQLIYSAGKSAGESLCRTWADAFGGKYEKVWILFNQPVVFRRNRAPFYTLGSIAHE
jgi:3-oxoacyl-[acyl-carrier protein] reductase